MDNHIGLSVAFLLGLGSSFHCVLMCGPIVSALALLLPAAVREQTKRRILLVFAYSFGRICSYSIMGAVFGFLVYLSPLSAESGSAHIVLQVLATLFLSCLGLHIAGWFPQMKRIELSGQHVWKQIQPIGKRFIPADTVMRAILVGAIWGWLPCGLVYSVLLWSLGSASPLNGSLYMFMFGLGTLPSMFFSGFFSSMLLSVPSRAGLKKLLGIFIVAIALLSLYLQTSGMHHNNSSDSASEHHHLQSH